MVKWECIDACASLLHAFGENGLLHVVHVAHFVEPKSVLCHVVPLHASRPVSSRARLRSGPAV